MAKNYDALSTNTTFGGWFQRTNDLSSDMKNVVLTVSSVDQPNTTNGGQTTGNTHVEGYLSASHISVPNSLRGGTISTPADLKVSSNVNFSANLVSTDGNTIFRTNSNVEILGATKKLSVALNSTEFSGALVRLTGETLIANNKTVTISSNNVSITTAANVTANVLGWDIVANTTNLKANTATIDANTTFVKDVTTQAALKANTVTANTITANVGTYNTSLAVGGMTTTANNTHLTQTSTKTLIVDVETDFKKNAKFSANVAYENISANNVSANSVKATSNVISDGGIYTQGDSKIKGLNVAGTANTPILTAPTSITVNSNITMVKPVTMNVVAMTTGTAANLVVQELTVTGNTNFDAVIVSGGSVEGDLRWSDNLKAKFGTNDDLLIHHTSNNSFIDEVGEGALNIRSDTGINLSTITGAETIATFGPNSSVALYHDNTKRLETSTTGVSVIGDLNTTNLKATGDISLTDLKSVYIGTDNDLRITHSGTDATLRNNTGLLNIETATNYHLKVGASFENAVTAIGDGAVSLFYDGAKKFETTLAGAKVTGDLIGTGKGTFVTAETTGDVTIGGALTVTGAANLNGTFNVTSVNTTGNTSLGPTTAQSLTVVNALNANSATFAGAVTFSGGMSLDGTRGIKPVTGDYGSVQTFGAGMSGMKGYSIDGSAAFVWNGTDKIGLYDDVNNKWILDHTQNGSTKIYHNGVAKITTTDTGVTIDGSLVTSGGLGFGDGSKFNLGSSNDLSLYHDGTNSYIEHKNSGSLYIDSIGGSNDIFLRVGGAKETALAAYDNGKVGLYYNGIEKIQTTSTGATVSGDLALTGGSLSVDDNEKILLGASSDLKVYHDRTAGNNIEATGALHITSTGSFDLKHGSDYAIRSIVNGDVQLYHNGVRKAYTKSTGFHVTGDITCNTITPTDGINLTEVMVGNGSGAVALENGSAGYDASISFNHKGGIPDNTDTTQSAGRIVCNVNDSVARMRFLVKNSTTRNQSTSMVDTMVLREGLVVAKDRLQVDGTSTFTGNTTFSNVATFNAKTYVNNELVVDSFRSGGNIYGNIVASKSVAEAGTANDKLMTPLRVKQAIDAAGSGLFAWARCTSTTVNRGNNIASISKVSTGRYRFTFQNNPSNNQYAVAATAQHTGSAGISAQVASVTTSYFDVVVHEVANGLSFDPNLIYVQVMW